MPRNVTEMDDHGRLQFSWAAAFELEYQRLPYILGLQLHNEQMRRCLLTSVRLYPLAVNSTSASACLVGTEPNIELATVSAAARDVALLEMTICSTLSVPVVSIVKCA